MLDLARARAAAEVVMRDRIVLRRDPQAEVDDVLDPDTLELEPAVGDAGEIYDGRALISPFLQERPAQEPRDALARRYRVRIPATSPEPRVGDTVEVAESVNDPALIDKTMKVVDVRLSSLLVTRQITCELELGERP